MKHDEINADETCPEKWCCMPVLDGHLSFSMRNIFPSFRDLEERCGFRVYGLLFDVVAWRSELLDFDVAVVFFVAAPVLKKNPGRSNMTKSNSINMHQE